MFNEQSGLVKIWVEQVQKGKYTLDQVPVISNLKTVVAMVINTSTTENGGMNT